MVAITSNKRLKALLLPVGFSIAGLIVAIGVAAAPASVLDAIVAKARLQALLSSAAPPIGATGRTVIALAAGLLVAGLGQVRRVRGWLPALRRADVHPDAPLRRPINARAELGEPLPIARQAPVPTIHERPLPADLDLPLATFDPDALPDVPREPSRAVAALAKLGNRPAMIDPGERFETFALTPVTSAQNATAPSGTIGALLDRLERGAARSPSPAKAISNLDETLQALRRLAASAQAY